jgi:drug/metabolite transporter (DMT)-like permease
MAPLILRETFRVQGLIGVIFAVFGASIVVFSSKSEEVAVGTATLSFIVNHIADCLYMQLSPELIMEALTQLRSIIYFAISGGLIFALTVLSPRYGSQSIMIDLGLVAIYGK